MLSGKYIVLGVTGGIAAYKSCELVSRLKKLGADVEVIMTENAARFVAPLTFETLSGKRVITDTFDRNFEYNVKHVSISKKASLFVVAPATANLIAKYRSGIADDMLTTTLLAVKCPVLICPAMNTAMYEHEATRENIKTLSDRGVHFLEPECGYLACGDNGKGRMAEPLDIVNKIEEIL
ncbi:MAG: bifunctional phosphopantothenoylcysteine decarboxylase/phosphopantothenate--cysteine ligase CoaBC, partial [Clostridiales bacterium]|nr:bifunctional phosphopantothenoylcysteine decarboxylase/phosphopantothenate--cysteine ligase CoaBC [Clostridiales bacterium]